MALLAALAAAKRRKRRRMGRYIKGAVNEKTVVGTLAAATLVTTAFDESVTETALVSSIVATYAMQGVTATDNAGPILVGIAHEDYTAAEIEEYIENTGSWDEGNKIQQEVAKRLVRRIGMFTETGQDLSWMALNGGRPIKTKLNWILTTGKGLQLWAYNTGLAAMVGSPDVLAEGHVNLWPR